MITENQLKIMSAKHHLGIPEIKAVAEIEGHGKGFLNSGEPVILFEPHVFWRCLKAQGINPKNYANHLELKDILYERWGEQPYGPLSTQHTRLQRAILVNKTAALEAASWGMFQILGENWSECECTSLQQFIDMIYKSENDHLELFFNLIERRKIVQHLRDHDWADFAESYNGPRYKENDYDIKLENVYRKYKLAYTSGGRMA